MGIFDRFLSLWVALAIVAGVSLGGVLPQFAEAVAALEFARINLPIDMLIWGMIYPMMLVVDFRSLGGLRRLPKGLAVTVVGVLVEVPVMLSLVAIANRNQHLFPCRPG